MEESSRFSKPLIGVQEMEVDEPSEQEINRFQLLTLTCTIGALQFMWATLNGNVNVYLLSIGIPASIAPLIWAIAPLCGTLVQPVVGWLSDRTDSRYGRRRPYVCGGMLGIVVSLTGLSWSQNFARAMSRSSDVSTVTVVITVMWVVLLNVSIQPFQMGNRARIIDSCPKAQQPQANAWAGCAASIGSACAYFVNFATASSRVHVFGFGHFKYLVLITSVGLIVTTTGSLLLFDDTYHPSAAAGHRSLSVLSLVHHFRSNLISSRTKIINRVQLCAWMGWFPFVFYMTTFVSNLASRTSEDAGATSPSTDSVAIKPGALAGFLYAVVCFTTSLLIPQLLRRTKYARAEIKVSSAAPIATILGFSLEKWWCMGQTFFGLLMCLTVFASTSAAGIVLIALAGIPWALALYVPFALIGIEVAEQRSFPTTRLDFVSSSSDDEEDDNDHDDEYEDDPREKRSNDHDNDNVNVNANANDHSPGQLAFGTGATIGLHNASISAPQIVAALLSAGILALSEKLGVPDGVGWVLRLSGLAAFASAWQIRKLFH